MLAQENLVPQQLTLPLESDELLLLSFRRWGRPPHSWDSGVHQWRREESKTKGTQGGSLRSLTQTSTVYGKGQPFSLPPHPPRPGYSPSVLSNAGPAMEAPQPYLLWADDFSVPGSDKHCALWTREVECFTVLPWLSLSLPACPRRGQRRRNSWASCTVSDNGVVTSPALPCRRDGRCIIYGGPDLCSWAPTSS